MEPSSDETLDSPPAKRARRLGSTSRGAASYTRKRAVTACQVCRSRRTKCDNKKPKCTFCERTGAECVMTPDDMSTFDPASLRILERLDELQNQVIQSIESNAHPATRPAARVPDDVHPQTPLPQRTIQQRRTHQYSLDAILNWDVVRPYWEAIPGRSTTSPSVPEAIVPSTSPLNADLDTTTCDHYLDNFFSFVHIKNPIFSECHTRRLVKRVFTEGIGWDEESCLALIICANGAIARSFFATSMTTSEMRQSQAPALYQAAQRRLGIVMANNSLVAAQCLFLFGVYKMYMLQSHDAWRMFLQALAACQQFKFSTGASDPSSPAALAHAEECIYWSCWKSERELRWVLNLPDFGELASDHPKSFPSLPESVQEGRELTAWYFYLSEISLWRLSTRTRSKMELFCSQQPAPSPESLEAFSYDLCEEGDEWQQSLAPAVKLDLMDNQDESEVLRFILRGHHQSYCEAIWWPFVDLVINQGTSSPTALATAMNGIASHLDQLQINEQGYLYRHHGTWLMIQSCIRSALVVLAASKIEKIAWLLPTGWEAIVKRTIAMLRHWHDTENAGASDSIISLLENLSM